MPQGVANRVCKVQPCAPGEDTGACVNQIILNAVQDRRLIRFWYNSEFRTVEPHCYGRDGKYSECLIGFQLGSNEWHWFHVPWMTRLSPISMTFDPRPDYARDEHGMEDVFAQV